MAASDLLGGLYLRVHEWPRADFKDLQQALITELVMREDLEDLIGEFTDPHDRTEARIRVSIRRAQRQQHRNEVERQKSADPKYGKLYGRF
jgi:hypothetical protein